MIFEGDPLGFYGNHILKDFHDKIKANLPFDLPVRPQAGEEFYRLATPDEKVGILGAGVGGLYTALILDSLDIKYEILEGSGRTGGRLFTYKFQNGGKYDYYDVGAMRYPLPKKDDKGLYKNGIMKRLGELIEYGPLNQGSKPLKSTLIPYYYKTRDKSSPGFYYFNGVHARTDQPKGDFNGKAMGVEPEYITAGTDAIISDVTGPFTRMLIRDMEQGGQRGWEVMRANDAYSVRAYMAFKYMPSFNLDLPPAHLTNNIVNWCGLLGGSSGWYDRALTEAVLGALAFAKTDETDFGDVEWKCFDGGSEVLSKAMEKYINGPYGSKRLIQFNKRIAAIRAVSKGVGITVAGEDKDRVYTHVISTLPLPCLRTIDMTEAKMNVMQKNALRQLQYGPSVKIGIRFSSPWWTTKLGIVGGQSFTDLPIRTIVYPSYGVDSDEPSTVLIASYCWTNDSERMGSLVGTDRDEQLKDLVLRNLVEVHGAPITYEFLKDQFREMHAWDWNHDPQTMGAFAYFGPGDFQDLFTSLSIPAADNRLHFAGEAISTRHAWVVGALDSAWRAVHEYLIISKQWHKLRKFKQLWGENTEWTQPKPPITTAQPKADRTKTAPKNEAPPAYEERTGRAGEADEAEKPEEADEEDEEDEEDLDWGEIDAACNLLRGHLGIIDAAMNAGLVKY